MQTVFYVTKNFYFSMESFIYYYNVQVSRICKLNKNYPRDKKKYSIVAIMRGTIMIYYIKHLPKLKKQKQLCPLYV